MHCEEEEDSTPLLLALAVGYFVILFAASAENLHRIDGELRLLEHRMIAYANGCLRRRR